MRDAATQASTNKDDNRHSYLTQEMQASVHVLRHAADALTCGSKIVKTSQECETGRQALRLRATVTRPRVATCDELCDCGWLEGGAGVSPKGAVHLVLSARYHDDKVGECACIRPHLARAQQD